MRRKTLKFKENAQSNYIIEPGKNLYDKIKGKWHELYFTNNQPIILELACGKGEYTTGLGRLFPDKNFIGIDIKGDRIWKGSKVAEEESLTNVAFLRIHILTLENFFAPGEADAIWITFPDPRPKKKDVKRRLTSPRYLDIYKKILKPGSWVHLKTDNTGLFSFTLETLEDRKDIKEIQYTEDLYQSDLLQEHHGITTKYERLFSATGENIKYLKFRIA